MAKFMKASIRAGTLSRDSSGKQTHGGENVPGMLFTWQSYQVVPMMQWQMISHKLG
jgi:hypothetical protein